MNEFLSTSVFKSDRRAELAAKAKNEAEEAIAREIQRERILREEQQKILDEHDRAEMRARHEAYLQLQRSLEQKEIMQEEMVREQREAMRLERLRQQRAQEAEEAAQRRELTLAREQHEKALREAQTEEARVCERVCMLACLCVCLCRVAFRAHPCMCLLVCLAYFGWDLLSGSAVLYCVLCVYLHIVCRYTHAYLYTHIPVRSTQRVDLHI